MFIQSRKYRHKLFPDPLLFGPKIISEYRVDLKTSIQKRISCTGDYTKYIFNDMYTFIAIDFTLTRNFPLYIYKLL